MTYRDVRKPSSCLFRKGEMNSKLLSRLALFSAVFCGALLILVIAFIEGILSPRSVAIIALAFCIIAVCILSTTISHWNKDRANRPVPSILADSRTLGSPIQIIWLLRILIAVCSIGLIVGLSTMAGKPIAPEIVGILIDLCLIASFISLLKKVTKHTRPK